MNSDPEKSDDWIDFKSIKSRVEVKPVLEYFGILAHLKPHGQELVGWCPFSKEHGKEDSFAVNVDKGSFQCFACKARGSVALDFIAKLRGITLREAAKVALEIVGEDVSGKETNQADRKTEKGRPYGKPYQLPPTETKKPETPSETKRPATKENVGKLSFFTWAHAEFLIQANKLDPSRLVVIDMNALEAFMKITVEKKEENTA